LHDYFIVHAPRILHGVEWMILACVAGALEVIFSCNCDYGFVISPHDTTDAFAPLCNDLWLLLLYSHLYY